MFRQARLLPPPTDVAIVVLGGAFVVGATTASGYWHGTPLGPGGYAWLAGYVVRVYRIDPHSRVQVWSEPDRAGNSSVVLDETDLDAAARATAAGISHDDPQPGGGARILQLTDPDGNRVVLTGA